MAGPDWPEAVNGIAIMIIKTAGQITGNRSMSFRMNPPPTPIIRAQYGPIPRNIASLLYPSLAPISIATSFALPRSLWY
jgi:hypothetical protein